MVASWRLGLLYHICGSSLLCANSTKKNSALYDACIIAAALLDTVAWRIHPNDAPASAINAAWLGPLPSIASGLLYAAVVVAVSATVFRFFEDPANRLIRGWARARCS